MARSADNLYLLSYLDVMDRLDILLLEVRHVQMSIIYNLRTPTLYLPLRYEEPYLFAERWADEQDQCLIQSSSSYDDVAIVRKWTLRYPTPKDAVRAYMNDDSEADNAEPDLEEDAREAQKAEIKETLNKHIGLIWLGDNWVREQRLQYHILFALQVLKQQIFRDKLTLTRGAIQANLRMNQKKKPQLSKAAFMVLRQGVAYRMNGYVDSLKNHKQHISKSNDFGDQQRSSGTIERRRELGIYMDFLSNRTRDIQRDILHLFSDLKLNDLNTQLVFHGWSEQTRVSNHYLNDDVNELFLEYNEGGEYKGIPIHDIGYINTSFWTPDRPDLQPIIAGKVSKTIIDNSLDGLDDVTLSNNTDRLTGLIVDFKAVLGRHIDAFKKHGIKRQHELVCDIAGDIVAASVKGVGYLYALFLLRVGDGLHRQLYVANEIKLDMAYMLEQGVADFSTSLYWYLRLRICAAWMRKIHHANSLNSLDEKVIEGVEQVADDLIDFLQANSPEYRKSSLLPIHSLSKEMLGVLDKHRTLVMTVRTWRQQRDTDDWDYEHSKSGARQYSRTTRKLDTRLQNYLFREVLRRKTEHPKPLYKIKHGEDNIRGVEADFKTLIEAFKTEYEVSYRKIKIPREKGKTCYHPKGLFEYMFDIPYQSSIIRSIDLLKKDYIGVPLKRFFTDIHKDIELGRALFAFALEFHTREKESPEHRLSLCINQITFAFKRLEAPELRRVLKDWMFGHERPFGMEKKGFDEYLIKNIVAKVKVFKKEIKEIGAFTINATFSSIPIVKVEKTRRMEYLAGFKILELNNILTTYNKRKDMQKDYQLLSPLLEFISIRRSNNASFATLHFKYYNQMLANMGDICIANKDKYEQLDLDDELVNHNPVSAQDCLPDLVPTVMLQRILITNHYPVPDPSVLSADHAPAPDVRNNSNENGILSYFSKPFWNNANLNSRAPERSYHWLTLGRFDALVVTPTRQPCKCKLPHFEKVGFLQSDDEKSNDIDICREQYYPFISRKEVAIPVWLTSGNRDALGFNSGAMKGEHCEDKLFAMMSVSLQRRGMRLDFLYRIIRALSGDEDDQTETGKSGLETKATALRNAGVDFHALLTDGWGDMVFVFIRDSEVLDEGHLDGLVDFQTAVNEDFMVDRTEMMFNPQCVDVALASENRYNVRMQVMLMEDRWLEPGISLHHEQVNLLNKSNEKPKFLADLKAKYLPSKNAVKLNITPLKQSELKELNKGRKNPIVIENSYDQIIRWIGNTSIKGNPPMKERLERIETSIVKEIIDVKALNKPAELSVKALV